jgi:hypothetical protein
VCFAKAGLYNLNRYKLKIRDEKRKAEKTIFSPFQHFIIIEDKNEIFE